jgi:hypothetical protein
MMPKVAEPKEVRAMLTTFRHAVRISAFVSKKAADEDP